MYNSQHNNFIIFDSVVNAIWELSNKSTPHGAKHRSELFRIVLNSRYCLINTENETAAKILLAAFVVLVGFGDIRFGILPNG